MSDLDRGPLLGARAVAVGRRGELAVLSARCTAGHRLARAGRPAREAEAGGLEPVPAGGLGAGCAHQPEAMLLELTAKQEGSDQEQDLELPRGS